MSPRGGYCSSASTPHSSNGGSSYIGNMNGYGGSTPTSTSQLSNMVPGSPSPGIFNSTPSKLTAFSKCSPFSIKLHRNLAYPVIVILVSPESSHYHFGAHNKPDKEKSAFAPVIRGNSISPAHPPAPALFHHQPVTGWHHLAVQC